ncbi:uncharacterized protein N7443_007892 [Penicillium atrosanguineum]|uniref:Uncharacterized protein n=1 Tax=Penicillium atrosanguineum TaxID=1132637 RepID=A0A9W9PMC2_9EURO|nr:uncharacterized protein N7443_007892 [Penicillium atrosanguineum]KAJ5296999.1 hypothetical protein N7443_007892 [Penicillium atrosanguineum]KAJ5299759.1 hypothetical protein N7476_011316 [Penicillium atrosanguineum]
MTETPTAVTIALPSYSTVRDSRVNTPAIPYAHEDPHPVSEKEDRFSNRAFPSGPPILQLCCMVLAAPAPPSRCLGLGLGRSQVEDDRADPGTGDGRNNPVGHGPPPCIFPRGTGDDLLGSQPP